MSLCAIIPVALLDAANNTLEQAGYGPGNFSVPLYSSTGATYGGLHTWGDLPFETAIKAIAGVVWEQSNGDPPARFKALVESQGVKWGANAPQLPSTGMVNAGDLYRDGELLWYVIQSFNRSVFGLPPETYPALIRSFRDPYQVLPWKQPLDQYDSYALLNPFTGTADKCKHIGKTWRSLINTNVWEPGAAGTESLWAEVT